MTATAQPKNPKRATLAAVAGHVERRVRPALDEHNKAALKAMRRARNFPANTCSGSRHTEQMAEQLIQRRPYPMLAEEPQHCGESMAWTVAALWNARTEIERLRDLLRQADERGDAAMRRAHAVEAQLAIAARGLKHCAGWSISEDKRNALMAVVLESEALLTAGPNVRAERPQTAAPQPE